MNEMTKERIAVAVIKAMEDEKLMNKEAAVHFGFSACYLSMIRNPSQYEHCPAKAWEAMRTWMYSGKKLKEYKFAGEILELEEQQEPEETPTKSHVIEPAPDKTKKYKRESKPEFDERMNKQIEEQKAQMKEVPDPAEELRIKVKPEALKERKRVLAKKKRKAKAETSPDKPPVTTNQTIRQGIFDIGTSVLYRPSEAHLMEENKSLKSELKTVSTLFKNQFELTERLRSELAFINAKFRYYHDGFFKITGTWWFKLFGRKFKNTE
jgi:hypothetical protein